MSNACRVRQWWRRRAGAVALTLAASAGGLAHGEVAERVIWHGRYEYNNQSPDGNHYTSNRGDAFAFAERLMRQRMLAGYSRCATPVITFSGEQDRTQGTGLLYYGIPRWRIEYLDGIGCSYWNQTGTSGEIFSYFQRYETGPIDERTCKTANPVQPGSGRKRFSDTDYAGAGAHPLTLVRHFSSRWTDGAATQGLASISAWDGGWRLNWQASLTLRGDGSLRAYRPDGSMRGLAPSAAGGWTATDGRDSVVALVDGSGQRTGYTYTASDDDSTETYDLAGKLLSVRQRNGWVTTLSYSDASTPVTIAPRAGLLLAVRNHFGRELRFSYDSQARIVEVLPPGAISGQPAGGANSPIRYRYEEVESLNAGVPAWSQMTSAVWQDGAVRRWHYDDGRWPQAVTGITDEVGVRYGTYAYDAEGRVTRSELAGGVERLEFAYASDASGNPTTTVTDYSGPGGSATSRSHAFADIGGVRYPVGVSAPCNLCGNTQQASVYNAQGDPIKTVAHDGTVTFHAYNAKGQETERATFPASFNAATNRPALANATKVVSTRWHGSFNLPTQVAEPGKFTAHTYNAKGMLTGQSWTATTDATGAAKFNAVKTGSTYATGWGYNANSLNTSIVTRETAQGSTTAVELDRWSATRNSLGDLTAETRRYTAANPPRPDETTRYTSRTADGLPTAIALADGKTATLTYKPRLTVDQISIADAWGATARTQFVYAVTTRPTTVTLPDNASLTFDYTSLGRLTAVGDSAGNRFEYTYAADGSISQRVDTGDASALDRRVLAAYDPVNWAVGQATVPTTPTAGQNASIADALALSTSKSKRASCIAACVAAGTYAGTAGGRYVGGAVGGTTGGVLGTAVPGVGTVALGTAGAVAGGASGARAGAWAGSLAGAALAAAVCPDDEDKCEKQRKIDEDRCVAVAGARYGRRGVAVCVASAFQRYSECLRFGVGGIRTPLAGADTPL